MKDPNQDARVDHSEVVGRQELNDVLTSEAKAEEREAGFLGKRWPKGFSDTDICARCREPLSVHVTWECPDKQGTFQP